MRMRDMIMKSSHSWKKVHKQVNEIMTEGKKRLLAYTEGETNFALRNQEGIAKKDF